MCRERQQSMTHHDGNCTCEPRLVGDGILRLWAVQLLDLDSRRHELVAQQHDKGRQQHEERLHLVARQRSPSGSM